MLVLDWISRYFGPTRTISLHQVVWCIDPVGVHSGIDSTPRVASNISPITSTEF